MPKAKVFLRLFPGLALAISLVLTFPRTAKAEEIQRSSVNLPSDGQGSLLFFLIGGLVVLLIILIIVVVFLWRKFRSM
jgi:hypothetical protein